MSHHLFHNRLFDAFTGLDEVWQQRLHLVDRPDLAPAPIQDLSEPPGCATFVPENYEPGYAYPLIVWLHGSGSNERELSSLMPAISAQNYIGVALRGKLPAANSLPGTFRWSQSDNQMTSLESELHDIVIDLRRSFHIHSERIYLAGFDDGAGVALKLLLRRPEWFAGAVTLGGNVSGGDMPLKRFRELRGKRLLIGGGSEKNGRRTISQIVAAGRLLHSAGLSVSTRIYDAGHEITPQMLTDIDHWIMSGIATATLV